MGQTPSTNRANDPNGGLLITLTKADVYNLFYTRCLQVLKPLELAFVRFVIDENDKTTISKADLKTKLSLGKGISLELWNELMDDVLFLMMKGLGKFPFLMDDKEASEYLTIQEFVIAFVFMLGRYNKVLSQDFDFLKLWFASLSESRIKQVVDDKGDVALEVPLLLPFEESDEISLRAKKVDWKNAPFCSLKDIDSDLLQLDAKSFVETNTMLLIASSTQLQKRGSMGAQFISRLKQWNEFEVYATSILRFIGVNLLASKLNEESILFDQFSKGVLDLLPNFYQNSLQRLSTELFTSSTLVNDEAHSSELLQKGIQFKPTKLVSVATLAYISSVLKGIGSDLQVTTENAVKLYAGSESGFSIRSLETKIFKWQAPTFLIVSGKRIKQKTMETNRRYQNFDEAYPRYFLKQENHLRPWQNDNDRITYCVVIKEPWQSSNKKNFGDTSTVILSMTPRADCYKSIHSDVTKGKLIYFNNQGMGLGFGNLQPLNKNGHQRYYPGDVSLTIEANLEFAVFRHLVQLKNNATNFFKPSTQVQLANENFEDRFTITDLEVWGIGSMKELDEQRKQWEWEEKQANARQSVNVRSMGEERAFLEMAGLVGNHGSYNR